MVGDRWGRSGRAIALLLFVVACTYLLARGVLRGVAPGGSGDLAFGYASARTWLDGLDPYLTENLVREHLASGGSLIGVAQDLATNVHPPPALPIFLSLSLTPWDEARAIALIANVVLTFAIIVGLTRFLGWRLTAPWSLVMAAFVLALAPVHTTISSGQSGIFVTAALVWAMVLEVTRPRASGLLLGLASALKVTIGLPFLAFALVRRRWTVAAVAIVAIAVLTAVSTVRMEIAGIPWMGTWTDNLADSLGTGGFNSADPTAPNRTSLVNLQYPLATLLGSEGPANFLTYALVAAGALLTSALVRDRDRSGILLGMSLVAALTLLVTYHRYYDAVLLAFPIAWGIWAINAGRTWLGAVVLILCADFLFPFQTALAQVAGTLPSWLTENLLWEAVVVAQHVWALVLLVVVLIIGAATPGMFTRVTRKEPASLPMA